MQDAGSFLCSNICFFFLISRPFFRILVPTIGVLCRNMVWEQNTSTTRHSQISRNTFLRMCRKSTMKTMLDNETAFRIVISAYFCTRANAVCVQLLAVLRNMFTSTYFVSRKISLRGPTSVCQFC